MNVDRWLKTTLAALALAWSLPAAEETPTGPRPFVERVQPVDFYAVESLFGQKISRDHEVIFLRTHAGRPEFALALKRPLSGDYTLTLFVPASSADAATPLQEISTDLPAPVGEQVDRAVELKLHRGVMLSPERRPAQKHDGDLWAYHRNVQRGVAASLIPFDSTVDNPTAAPFLDGVLGNLQKLIGAEGAARAALLEELDRIATEIVLRDTPQ